MSSSREGPAVARNGRSTPVLPPGYGARRGLNWSIVGFLYTSFYMCRYNISIANKPMSDELGFSKGDMGDILAGFFYAYAFGQVLNGLFTDRLGGKKAMLIGAAGTILTNILVGAASFWGMLWLFILLRSIDGYSQSFGSPGFIKINASWFSQNERGTFAGVFGFMINLGRVAINQLGPALLAGFVFVGLWQIPPLHWRWLFWVPAGIAAVVAVTLALVVKDTPEEAGFHGVYKGESDHDEDPHGSLKDVFLQIVTNKYVWIMAAAYSCTGAVRQTVDQWFPRYMQDVHKINLDSGLFLVVGFLIPFVASAGSFISGVISDHVFGGRRAPVAAGIYCIEILVIVLASRAEGGADCHGVCDGRVHRQLDALPAGPGGGDGHRRAQGGGVCLGLHQLVPIPRGRAGHATARAVARSHRVHLLFLLHDSVGHHRRHAHVQHGEAEKPAEGRPPGAPGVAVKAVRGRCGARLRGVCGRGRGGRVRRRVCRPAPEFPRCRSRPCRGQRSSGPARRC
jgi:OPA family glycerol-3-phosphate transporter-like MFS transporter